MQTTIPDIFNMPHDALLDSVQGKITEVYPRKSGGFGPKSWTLQGAHLVDGGGNKLKLTVWNHPEITPLKGTEVVVHSSKGKGLKVVHGEFKNSAGEMKKTVEVHVDKFGCFQTIEVYNRGAANPAATSPSQGTAPATVAQPQGASQAAPLDRDQENRDRLKKLATLWLSCAECVAKYVRPNFEFVTETVMSDDQFQSCVASLFIQGTRDNIQIGKPYTVNADNVPMAN